MIQHDMMLFDHGMPRADGTVAKEQRPEADVNIEFQSLAKQAEGAQKLAWALYAANEAYATDYPAAVGPHMTNTDSHALHGSRARDQRARERARHRRSAPAGTRTGISRPMCTRRSATPISASV